MEYKRKCNVCGKIYCFTDEDLHNNTKNAGLSALEALGGLASTLGGGTIFHTQYLQGQSDRYADKVVDYDQCPYCHSRGVSAYIGEIEMPAPAIPEPVVARRTIDSGASTESLLKRAFLFLEDEDWKAADAYCEACLDRDPELAEAYLGKLLAELELTGVEELSTCPEPFDESKNYKKALRYADVALRNTLTDALNRINTRNESERLNGIYRDAKDSMAAADTEAEYIEAAQLFDAISEYRDSAVLAKTCYEKAEIVRKDAIWEEGKYEMASGDYESAIRSFASIPGWKDADEKAAACQKELKESKEKEEAERLEKERQAERTAKRSKRIAMIVTPIVCAVIAFVIVLNVIIIPNNNYNNALALMDAGKYEEAIAAFKALNGYKDSASNFIKLKTNALKTAKVGEYVIFGSYEQDNSTSNRKEDIEWLVLEKSDNKILVISKYALDCQRYNTERTSVTWEICSLRQWLNKDFLNAAFSTEEQAMIPTVTVSADKNPSYNTDPGKETQDKVFLLSIEEVNEYDSARQCAPTDYAVANGAYVNRDNGNCWWWLRSPGYYQHSAADVDSGGSIMNGGVDTSDGAIRPALWIDLRT